MTTKLRGVEFQQVWGASGVQGFFGEGYRFHRFLEPFGLNFRGMTFVAKTTTLEAREGNMPLRSDFTPQELFPKCVVVKPRQGIVLNSVGLSGPGAKALLEEGSWQMQIEPFFISFMSVAKEPSERHEELRKFIQLLGEYLPTFRTMVGLQLNYSCPNVGLHTEALLNEVSTGLKIAAGLGIPLVPKFNLLLPVRAALQIAEHPNCDGICISNTIPWGQLPDLIRWRELFGSDVSPLAHIGGGGLSGKPLLYLLEDWLLRARGADFPKPINAGGGILSLKDAQRIKRAGAASIFLGSIAILRPWRVANIITAMNS